MIIKLNKPNKIYMMYGSGPDHIFDIKTSRTLCGKNIKNIIAIPFDWTPQYELILSIEDYIFYNMIPFQRQICGDCYIQFKKMFPHTKLKY